MRFIPRNSPLLLSALLTVILSLQSQAAPPPASAVLSSRTAAVGEPVTLQITVEGVRVNAPELSVDGLVIQYVGQSTQVQMLNFDLSTSVMFTYQVAGVREGTYTIPALEFLVHGKRVRTRPLELVVRAGGTPPASSGAGTAGTATGDRQVAFGELIVGTDDVYVGQAIPVELRMYFDTSVRTRVDGMPTIESGGFTVEKLSEPRQTRVEKDGRSYDVLTFQTVITPVKTGEVEFGPAQIQCTISLPRKRRTARHIDDFFDDDFFNDPFGAFGQNQSVVVQSDAPVLDVKPLPLDSQPEGFTGAIGQFTLQTRASSDKVVVGEPLTLTVTVSGKGNFSRVSQPVLTDEEGWRSYPGSDRFTPADKLGLTGSKSFEVSVVPERPLEATPGVAFSYFNPADGNYVTLTSNPIAIDVRGNAINASASTTATSGIPAQPKDSNAETGAGSEASELHEIVPTGGESTRSFSPLYTRAGFWAAQGIPLLGLLTFAVFRIRKARQLDTGARALKELRNEREQAMERVAKDDTSPEDFYAAAVRVVQIEAAIVLGRNPASIGIEDALEAHTVDSATGQSIRRLFATRDELIYAGTAHRDDHNFSPDLRDAFRQAIRTYESA